MAKSQLSVYGQMMCVLFILSVLAEFVVGEDKPVQEKQDPKKTLENLGNFFKQLSGDGDCKFNCPGGSAPMPRPGHIPASNGCGSMGIKLDTSLFPGFTTCCDKHDQCYDTCNSNREECDSQFKECLDNVCEKIKHTRPPDQVSVCESAGGVMQTAAVGLGCNSYKQAQANACVCSGNIIGKEEEDEDEDEDEEEDSKEEKMQKRKTDEHTNKNEEL